MCAKGVDLSRVGTDLADELTCFTKEKSYGATSVADGEQSDTLRHHIDTRHWVVLKGRHLATSRNHGPLLIDLWLKEKGLPRASRKQDSFRPRICHHSHDRRLHCHRESTISHELSSATLHLYRENASIIGSQSNELFV